LEERHALSVWDVLIIEAAGRAGANHLVSEDPQHGRGSQVLSSRTSNVAPWKSTLFCVAAEISGALCDDDSVGHTR
jgi:predicted nucleic acid-binding protein